MKKILILSTFLILVAFSVVVAQEVKTIKGEVVDVSCYVTAGAKGAEHKDCAITCIQAGQPAGILEEETGKLYVVIAEDHAANPAQKVLAFVAKMVEVTGVVNQRGGLSTIDIKDIKEIKVPSTGVSKEGKVMMKENAVIGGR